VTREQRTGLLKDVRRVLVKVGTGVLTEGRHLDLRVISRLADEISLLREKGLELVMVTSGAVATGTHKLKLGGKPADLPGLQAAAAAGQSRLMQEYEAAFGRYGLKVAQILLTLEDLTHRRRYLNARNTLFKLIEWGVLPIINENDTVAVEELKFGDNDNLSAMITNMIGADLYINLTRVEGFFEGNPLKSPEARVIPYVEELTEDLEVLAESEGGAWGMGGMHSKVQAACKVALCGIPAVIASGKDENILRRVLAGEEVGTFFAPRPRLESRKHWIAFTLKSRGELMVDEGAARAVRERGKSLLPSGVLEVKGRFQAGDQVKVLGPGDEVVAVGLTNYSSADLNKIKGLKTRDIVSKLGYKDYDEVVHRDNMFVPGEQDGAVWHLLS